MDTSLNPSSGQKLNDAISKWGSMVQRKLRVNASQFSHGKGTSFVLRKDSSTEGKLADSIVPKYGKFYGTINRVTFSFERHGVFVHKGVGKGYAIVSGFVQRTARGTKEHGENSRTRQPKDWFNAEIEKNLPELADKLAEINADMILNATKLMIK